MLYITYTYHKWKFMKQLDEYNSICFLFQIIFSFDACWLLLRILKTNDNRTF